MIPQSPQKSGRQASGEEQEFLKIARHVSDTIGAEFFCMLADQLAGALSAKCVYVGEFVRGNTDRVRTLAACGEGDRAEGFEFPLAGSPDAEVALGNPCIYARGVREMFPGDRLLHDLEAEAFVAVPLNDAEGLASGLIATLFGQPLHLEISFVQSILKDVRVTGCGGAQPEAGGRSTPRKRATVSHFRSDEPGCVLARGV
jgi:hypothetical protein